MCTPLPHQGHTHTILKKRNLTPFFGRKCAGNHNVVCLLVLKVYPHTFHFPVNFQYLPPLSSPLTKLTHTQPQICFQVPPKTLSHTLRSTRNAPLYSLWQTMWTKVLARFKINFTGQKYISLCTYFI